MTSSLVRRIALGLAIIAGAILLARWLTALEQTAPPSVATERIESSDRARGAPSQDSALPPDTGAPPPATGSPESRATDVGSFRGRVIDAVTRKPVGEFAAVLQPFAEQRERAQGPRTFRTPDGRFEWDRLPFGDWTLVVDVAGYQRFEHSGVRIARDVA